MRKPAGHVRLSFIRPMEPELVEQPPKGGEWGHEVKFDGYRTQVIKDADGIRLHQGEPYVIAYILVLYAFAYASVLDANPVLALK